MDGWLNGLISQGLSILAGFGVLVLILVVVVISKVSQKK